MFLYKSYSDKCTLFHVIQHNFLLKTAQHVSNLFKVRNMLGIYGTSNVKFMFLYVYETWSVTLGDEYRTQSVWDQSDKHNIVT
jgi:hypothetical protein